MLLITMPIRIHCEGDLEYESILITKNRNGRKHMNKISKGSGAAKKQEILINWSKQVHFKLLFTKERNKEKFSPATAEKINTKQRSAIFLKGKHGRNNLLWLQKDPKVRYEPINGCFICPAENWNQTSWIPFSQLWL